MYSTPLLKAGRNILLSKTIRNPRPPGITHSDTEALTATMHASIPSVNMHRCVLKSQSGVATGERSVEDVWNFLSAADKFVGLATSAIAAAYQTLAARIFSDSTQARCTFIYILKLYVTHTGCITKWRPLKHNDYETIIIWRSTRGGPHPKCSQRAAYKGHARAVALISKRNFCLLSRCLSLHLSLRRSSLFRLVTIEMHKKHRECSIACEI